ncbi:MAG: hypothetical protein AAGA30_12680 [Planctomycetota bacterium]
MNILVNDKQKLLSQSATFRAKSKAAAVFAKYDDMVQSVVISIKDINGPKGGIDKECKILVNLKKLNDISVSIKTESLSKAIPFSLNRAARTLGRMLDRRLISAGRKQSF